MSLSIKPDSHSTKLQTSYQNLAAAANTLNAAYDTFGSAANTVEEALNKLDPGVTAWVTLSTSMTQEDAPWEIFEERLGYGKANGRWGLTLCTVTKNEKGEKEIKDSWLFNDAPRNLRLKAIEHVPALIEALAREAAQTAKKVSDGADFARQLAVSISAVAHAKGNRR